MKRERMSFFRFSAGGREITTTYDTAHWLDLCADALLHRRPLCPLSNHSHILMHSLSLSLSLSLSQTHI
jgi:hypothetical protein